MRVWRFVPQQNANREFALLRVAWIVCKTCRVSCMEHEYNSHAARSTVGLDQTAGPKPDMQSKHCGWVMS